MEAEIPKKQFIDELTPGTRVNSPFVLSEKAVAQKRDGNNYLTVELADKTGHLKGVVWDHVSQVMETVNSGDVVHVNGNVSEFRGERQLVVKQIRSLPIDSIDPTDFLPATERSVEAMFDRLMQMTAAFESEDLRALFEAFWADEEFVAGFKQAPAAKFMHHAYIGGLLEHCVSMASLAEKVGRHYTGIDTELLVAGAILHDVGKVREFEYSVRIDYSDEGRLVSHIVIGVEMLDEKIGQVTTFSPQRAHLLKHMIVSHHGSREFGSPEPPKTIEAVLLNYIDEIDSKVNGIRRFITGEDPAEAWTSYHRLLGRQFYTGKAQTKEGPGH